MKYEMHIIVYVICMASPGGQNMENDLKVLSTCDETSVVILSISSHCKPVCISFFFET